MGRVDVRHSLDDTTRGVVYALVEEVASDVGRRPLSDQLWLDLNDRAREGFTAVLSWSGEQLAGYGQLARGAVTWTLELVIPAQDEHTVAPELLAAALGAVGEAGGGEVHWWSFHPTPAIDAVARAAGLTDARALFQMRAALPLADEVAAPARAVPTRPFRVGHDEDAWLEVNNAAFAGHPEQGGWDAATLCQREAQPWFDATGFLLHERDGRLAAFCWTKVHADEDPPLGEIYVIAVHPDFHGLGLGKAMTVAGLDHLAGRGLTTGMLYVDRDNTAAASLYRRLGFTTHRTDQAFVATVPAAPPAARAPGDPA
jgi:mycothiol synthase